MSVDNPLAIEFGTDSNPRDVLEIPQVARYNIYGTSNKEMADLLNKYLDFTFKK